MPVLTRRFIKIALLYLLVSLLIGVALVSRTFWSAPPLVSALNPVYFHLFMVGWVTCLIFGVVYWMFPRYTKDKPRVSETAWQIIFWLLNGGLILRAVVEPLQALRPKEIWNWLLALSALLQWGAGLIFVAITWMRVKER